MSSIDGVQCLEIVVVRCWPLLLFHEGCDLLVDIESLQQPSEFRERHDLAVAS